MYPALRQELTREPHMANQELHRRRLRMDHTVSSAVAAAKTDAAYGRWAYAIGCGTSAVPGLSAPGAADD